MKNIVGNNNKLIFILDDGTEIEEFNNKEIQLIENFPLFIDGENNSVKIKIGNREDVIKFLSKNGLAVYVYGHNNSINIGKILCPANPSIGLTGLTINIGNPPEDTIECITQITVR